MSEENKPLGDALLNNAQGVKGKQIQIKATDEVLSGRYANAMQVLHTKEEFVLDFMNIVPPQGSLNARIIMSPGHAKRVVAALVDNIKKYEAQFGELAESKSPQVELGFKDR